MTYILPIVFPDIDINDSLSRHNSDKSKAFQKVGAVSH